MFTEKVIAQELQQKINDYARWDGVQSAEQKALIDLAHDLSNIAEYPHIFLEIALAGSEPFNFGG